VDHQEKMKSKVIQDIFEIHILLMIRNLSKNRRQIQKVFKEQALYIIHTGIY